MQGCHGSQGSSSHFLLVCSDSPCLQASINGLVFLQDTMNRQRSKLANARGTRLTFIMEVSLVFFFSSLFRTFWQLFLILASISYHSLIPVMFPPLSLAHTQIGQGEPVCAKLKEKLVWLCTNLLSSLRVARCYQQVPEAIAVYRAFVLSVLES